MAGNFIENQQHIPPMGFGTYGRRGPEGIAALLTALETGYRHFDTAQDYGTERECGEAFRRSGLKRDEMFFTTKVATFNLDRGKVVPSIRKSLDEMGLDALDLVLIHWPAPHERLPVESYVEQLAEAQALGLTRLIGGSNFTIAHLQKSAALLGRPLDNDQFEMNPYLQNSKLVSHCLTNGTSVTCYIPIARGRLAGDPVMGPIAERHGATIEQVALAWELQRGLIVIPTSGQADRIRSNYAAINVHLTPDEMAAIDRLDRGERIINPEWGPAWD